MAIRPKLKRGLSLLMILSLLLFTGCTDKKSNSSSETATGTPNKTASDTGTTAKAATVSTVTQTTGEYSDKDLDASWDEASAIKITFDKQNITSSNDSVTIKDNTATITKSGTYVLSGTLTDGNVYVEAGDNDNVKLVLNNADMKSSTTAPIYIKNAKNVYLTLAESSVNTVTDASKYVYAGDAADEPSAAIFSKADLTINGSGTLNVNGKYNNAIQSKDDLKIISGTLTVTSVDDGIIGKDSISIKSGTITVNSTGDAVKSTNTKDTSKGFIIIDGGTFDITSGADGFQAETSLIINDGSFHVTTGGGSANAVSKAHNDFKGGFGKDTDQTSSGTAAASTGKESSSAKGFKSASVLTINGGTFTVDSSDDSFHSNGTLAVTDGTFTISSGDDAMHADTELTLSVNKLDIKKSYEGIESANIIINSGDISLVSSDDGINASESSKTSTTTSSDNNAGSDSNSSTDSQGGKAGFESSGNAALTINGGTITMSADGDGLDANGSITINDGTIYLSGPSDDGNGPLDYDTTFTMNGGTLVAAGSSGMAQAPSDGSKQTSVAYVFDSAQTGGTKISLADADGKEVISYTPKKNYQYILISSPLLEKSQKYTLSSNGTSVYAFTISETVNANTTIQTTGGPGGFGGGGRGQGGNGGPSGKFGGNTDNRQGSRPDSGTGNTPPDIPNGNTSGTGGNTSGTGGSSSNNTDSGSGT